MLGTGSPSELCLGFLLMCRVGAQVGSSTFSLRFLNNFSWVDSLSCDGWSTSFSCVEEPLPLHWKWLNRSDVYITFLLRNVGSSLKHLSIVTAGSFPFGVDFR